MTKREIALVKKAIFYIHHKDEYYKGMNILAKLVGYPEVKLPTKPCSIAELIEQARKEALKEE